MKRGNQLPEPAVVLDEIDRKIITALQADGRTSYADLGPLVGLSAAAARQRVQRLIESRALQVVGVTDPMALGYPSMAMLGVSVDGDVVAIADRIAEIEGVIYVVLTSGRFDIMVEVLSEDAAGLLAMINDRIKAISGVRSVESHMYFGIHTHRFGWAPRA